MTSDGIRPRKNNALIVPSSTGEAEGEAEYVIDPYSESSELVKRLDVLKRYWPILLLALVAGGAIAGYRHKQHGIVYRANSTVRFDDPRAQLTSGLNNQQQDEFWRLDPVKSETELLTSRPTLELAVDSNALQVRPANNADLAILQGVDASKVSSADTLRMVFSDSGVVSRFHGQNITSAYGAPVAFPDLSFTVPAKPAAAGAKFFIVPREWAIGELSGIQAVQRPETNIADFTLAGPDSALVRRELNAATVALQQISRQSEQRVARDRRKFLDQQLRTTDSTLEVQRAQLSAFRSQAQVYSSKDKITLQQTTLANVRTRREELAADRQVFTSLLASALAAKEKGDPSALRALISAPGMSDNTAIMQLYSQLQKLTLARDSLTKGPFASAATNPDVQRISGQIESTTDEFILAVKNQITGFDARIKALDDLATRTAADVSSMPSTEAEEQKLTQEADGTQRIADQLRDEQQRARISEVAEGGKVEIIDLARQASRVFEGGANRVIAIGALLGLLIAAGAVSLYEEMDTSLRRKSDVERLLGLPTLGSIPSISRVSKGPGMKMLNRIRPQKKTSNATSIVKFSESPVFESYRAIRTSLIFSNAVDSIRSVGVTSSSPGDGKSTTTSNLATAFAQQGLRVLVIDCDLRRGSLHKLLNVPRSPGLTHAIAAGGDLADVVKPTAVENLFVVTAGIHPPNPSELLGSARMRDLLAQAHREYDLVLIDTPPVLAAADASIIASMVDGMIMVIRIGATTRSAARTAQERLTLVGSRIIGTVLNDPSEHLESSEQYYYYDYSSAST